MLIKIACFILVFSTYGLAQVTRTKVNSLEKRRADDIAAELVRSQADVTAASKAVTRAQSSLSSAQSKASTARSALTAYRGADARVRAALANNVESLQAKVSTAQDQLALAQAHAVQASKRLSNIQAAQTDWNTKTLHSHRADDGKHILDWGKGQVVAK